MAAGGLVEMLIELEIETDDLLAFACDREWLHCFF